PRVEDILGIVVIAPVGWLICWHLSRRLSQDGVQLRHRRALFIATAGAVMAATIHIWAMRGLQGTPYQWLADPIVAAIALQPIIFMLCTAQAGVSSGAMLSAVAAERHGRPPRSHGFLWRRSKVAEED